MTRPTLRTLASFLPPHVVRSLRKGTPAPPFAERLPAALLLSDVSGFTALTERLQARGREGAEEITLLIDAAFGPAIGAIGRHGGSIVSFGGDSLFAVFPGGRAVRRALAAAHEIRGRFETRRFTAGGGRLGIAQAVHYGCVRGLHLGSAARRHYVAAGAAVAALARLQRRAATGEIVVSPAARGAAVKRGAWVRQGPRAALGNGDTLRTFFAPALLPILGRFEGDFREVAVCFLETASASLRLLSAFFLRLEAALHRYDGVLLKTDLSADGTKWLCAFGIPATHEDDAERAGRAALDVLASSPRSLPVRGALHAGTVVAVEVGTRQRRSLDAMGDVVNTAARALSLAAWGEVVVTEATRGRAPAIDADRRGLFPVKGKAEPLAIHTIRRVAAAGRPVQVTAPLVGRDPEMAEIRSALLRCRDGAGSLLGIRGDAGLGKSRLKWEASRLAASMGIATHEGRATAFTGMPYGAVAELLRHALHLPRDAGRDLRDRVRGAADRLGLPTRDRHHLANVLGVRLEGSPLHHLPGDVIRANDAAALRSCLRALARERPLLLVLEDLHWADEMTREAVAALARDLPGMAAVLLLLYRPGYTPPPGVRELILEELPEAAVDEMLEAILGGVPASVGGMVRRRAEGNPLYVEETVRHLRDSGVLARTAEGYLLTREPGALDLPATLEALLEARFDRLSREARSVLQLGAVLGRSFSCDLLRTLDPGATRQTALEELREREILFERSAPDAAGKRELIFKHALLRDVAYGTILTTQRRKLHRRAAEALDRTLGEERGSFQSVLGHHWHQAGDVGRAREAYLQAARAAVPRFAHEEAERLFRLFLGLSDVPSIETVAARNELGKSVLRVRGRMAEALAEHTRALADARKLGDPAAEAASLRELGVVHQNTGRTAEASDLYRQALSLARGSGDREREGILLSNLAILAFYEDREEDARALLEQGLALHLEAGDRLNAGIAMANLANVHASQGRAGEARSLYTQALAIAREEGGRRAEGYALGQLGNLLRKDGQLPEARSLILEALAIHREIGDRRLEGASLDALGSLYEEEGDRAEATRCYEEALRIARDAGDRISEVTTLKNLARLCLEEREAEAARDHFRQALATARETGRKREEGRILVELARVERHTGGNLVAALQMLVSGEEALREAGDAAWQARCLCERGLVEVGLGTSARASLERARILAAGEVIEGLGELEARVAEREAPSSAR